MVKVKFSSVMVRATKGDREAIATASNVKELLQKLAEKYGEEFAKRVLDEQGGLKPFINMYVNGKDIRFLGGLSTPLNEGDEVLILPAISGGLSSGRAQACGAVGKGANEVR